MITKRQAITLADKIVKNSDLEHVQEKLVNEIETMLLSDPLVHALTGKGIQRFVSEITHAFGKSVHQGVSLHTDDNGVVADISVVSFSIMPFCIFSLCSSIVSLISVCYP